MAAPFGPYRDRGRAELALEHWDRRVYRTGDEYFPALLQAIAGARRCIYFEVYIFRADEIGVAIARALRAAARRGVRVRLLLDAWGASGLAAEFTRRLTADGVELLFFQPLGRWFRGLKKNFLRRLHRKVVVIDGELAFVGGINVSAEQATRRGCRALFDYAVSVCGPQVSRIELSSRALWRSVRDGGPYPRSLAMPRIAPPSPACVGGVEFVTRDNFHNRAAIEKRYLLALDRARSEVLIANAYFFPSRRFRRSLRRAAGRGVRVSLILQGRVDVVLIRYATKALYRQLLRAGIEIYEDHAAVVHAKVAVFDGRSFTVGSSNLDPISLGMNLEANLFIEDARRARHLRAQLEVERDECCRRVDLASLAAQPWYERAFSWLCFGVVRFLSRFAQSRSM